MKGLTCLLLLVAAPGVLCAQSERPLLIRGVKPAPGRPPVDILVRRGLIDSVGPRGSVSRPFDAEVFDAEGLLLGPAFLDAAVLAAASPTPSTKEPKSASDTPPPLRSVDDDIDTRTAALDRSHPDRRWVREKPWDPRGDSGRRRAGIAWALYFPAPELCAGSGVLATTAAAPRRSRVLAPDLGLLFALDRRRGAYPSTTMGAIAFLRQLFADARWHRDWTHARSGAAAGVPRPPFEPGLARIEDVLAGERPAFHVCRTEHEARRILALFRDTKARLVLVGPPRLARAAEAIAKAGACVILQAEFPDVTDPALRKRLHLPAPSQERSKTSKGPPQSSDLATKALSVWIRGDRRVVRERERKRVRTFLNAPRRFVEAGVPFAFATSTKGKGEDLLSYARLAVEAGLSKNAARRALTAAHPRLPFSRQLEQGIRRGRAATFTLLDGPIWTWKTRIEAVVIDGRLEVLKKKEGSRNTKKQGDR